MWGVNESLGNLSSDDYNVYTPTIDVYNQSQSDYNSDDVSAYEGNFAYNSNVLSGDNFYSQVIHKTNGGQLPFIFQPDSGDNTQFAICKFDMNSFQFKQVANGVYNVKLKIREVW